jgi:hypothetical protein
MTPQKLAKIRRLAEDTRGDPATRAIAQAALKRYAEEQPKPQFRDVPPWEDRRVPGMKTSAEHERFMFMDIGAWRKSANGNPVFNIARGGILYRIVIFRHKKTPTWGWMRVNTSNDETDFSSRFATMGEAHSAAWRMLTAL